MVPINPTYGTRWTGALPQAGQTPQSIDCSAHKAVLVWVEETAKWSFLAVMSTTYGVIPADTLVYLSCLGQDAIYFERLTGAAVDPGLSVVLVDSLDN